MKILAILSVFAMSIMVGVEAQIIQEIPGLYPSEQIDGCRTKLTRSNKCVSKP